MGLLDKILNREARKIISGVVAAAVDGAMDTRNQSNGNSQPQSAVNTDEADCRGKKSVVCKRIETIIAENFSGCELREQVSSREIGAGHISWKYTYGVYRDGIAVAMINILENPNDYGKKIVLQSKEACKDRGIGYVHFILRLPNRSSYILERLQEIIPV